MYFDPQPVISSMQYECETFDRAINRVLNSWDDRVSESMQASCIGNLASAGQNAVNTMTTHGNIIADLLDEMEYFARR